MPNKVGRVTLRGQTRSTVYFRHPDTGQVLCDGTYPKKIAVERVRALLSQLEGNDFTNPQLGRQPFRVYAELWFAARPVIASTKKIRSYLDSQLLPAFGDLPLASIDRFGSRSGSSGSSTRRTRTPARTPPSPSTPTTRRCRRS